MKRIKKGIQNKQPQDVTDKSTTLILFAPARHNAKCNLERSFPGNR